MRESHIELPDEAVADEEAEVIVLFKSTSPAQDERLAAMRKAMNDGLFIADLTETMEYFQHADLSEGIV